MSLSVYLSVRSLISKITRPEFTKFLCVLPVAVVGSSSGDFAVRYVLPVLLMTSCFNIDGPVFHRVFFVFLSDKSVTAENGPLNTRSDKDEQLIHDLLFLPISTIESAVGKRLITHCCVSRLACSRFEWTH